MSGFADSTTNSVGICAGQTSVTGAFCGGVYEHSNAAHNLLATMRVGALHGGLEHVDPNALPPAQRLILTDSVDAALTVGREGR